MDLWVIIVVAVVLIVLFIAVAGRSLFGSGGPKGAEPREFSDDPGAGRK
jgi:hypothetical protein